MTKEPTEWKPGHQRSLLPEDPLPQSSLPIPHPQFSTSQEIASQIDSVLGLVPGIFCISKIYHVAHRVARIETVVLDSIPREALVEAASHLAETSGWSIDIAAVTVTPGLVEGATTILWEGLIAPGEIVSMVSSPLGVEIRTRNPWYILPGTEQTELKARIATILGTTNVFFEIAEQIDAPLVSISPSRSGGNYDSNKKLSTDPETRKIIRSLQKILRKDGTIEISPGQGSTIRFEYRGAADQSAEFTSTLALAQSHSPLPITSEWNIGVREITRAIERVLSTKISWAARFNPHDKTVSILTPASRGLSVQEIDSLERMTNCSVITRHSDITFLSPSSNSTLIFPSSYAEGRRFPGSQQLIRQLRESVRVISPGATVRISDHGISVGVMGSNPSPATISSIKDEVRRFTALPVFVDSVRDTSSLISVIAKSAPPEVKVIRVSFRGKHVAIIRAQVEKGAEPIAYAWRDRLEKQHHAGFFLELRTGSSNLSKRLRNLAGSTGVITDATLLKKVVSFVPYRPIHESLDLSKEIDGRVDLRRVRGIINLDEMHVPDIDQAYSIHKMQGRLALAVHIPDLTAFAPPESVPYAYARANGSAVYGKDHMVPLYPPDISLGKASLHPGEDRLAFTFMIAPNKDGSIAQFKLFPSVIKNSEHLTATEFQSIINGEDHPLRKSFKAMARIAHTIHQRRTQRSSVDIEEGGERGEVVQEFSLLVNRLFPKHEALRGVPIAYRVHDAQTPRTTAVVLRALRELGVFGTLADFNDPIRWRDILHQAHEALPKQEFYHLLHASFGSARYALKGSHHALGFSRYAQVSAPCRRLLDGVNWYQFSQVYFGKDPLPLRKIQGIIAQVNRQEQVLDDKFSELLHIESIYSTLSAKGRIYEGSISRHTSTELLVTVPGFRVPGLFVSDSALMWRTSSVAVLVVGYDPKRDRFVFKAAN